MLEILFPDFGQSLKVEDRTQAWQKAPEEGLGLRRDERRSPDVQPSQCKNVLPDPSSNSLFKVSPHVCYDEYEA